MEQQAGAVPPERIRYRLTRFQRVMPMLPYVSIVLTAQVLFWLSGGAAKPLLLAAVFGVVVLVLELIPSPFGVTLTPSAAVVHNFRRRTIPWSNVQAIGVEPVLGTRTVVIYEAGGRSTRLRAPMTGFLNWDSAFEQKFHTIGGWWLDHRGPDWVPAPPPRAWWAGPSASGGDPLASPE